MARPIRIQYPGAFYHIMSRGNERSDIFKNKQDYQNFLTIFSDVIERYNWQSFAYCLMPNHYHLLIKTHKPNLSLGMRQLNGKYTQEFNIKHKRVGHLFQGRFKSVLVEEENYKNELIRYINLNPKRANLVKSLKNWKYNSYLEIIGEKNKTNGVDIKAVLDQFDEESQDRARINYLEYIHSKVEEDPSIDNLKRSVILGSPEFIEKVKDYFKKQKQELEIPKRERLAFRPALEEIFKNKEINKKERNDLIYKAHMDFGYSLVKIGGAVDLHYSSISAIVNNIIAEKNRRLE